MVRKLDYEQGQSSRQVWWTMVPSKHSPLSFSFSPLSRSARDWRISRPELLDLALLPRFFSHHFSSRRCISLPNHSAQELELVPPSRGHPCSLFDSHQDWERTFVSLSLSLSSEKGMDLVWLTNPFCMRTASLFKLRIRKDTRGWRSLRVGREGIEEREKRGGKRDANCFRIFIIELEMLRCNSLFPVANVSIRARGKKKKTRRRCRKALPKVLVCSSYTPPPQFDQSE